MDYQMLFKPTKSGRTNTLQSSYYETMCDTDPTPPIPDHTPPIHYKVLITKPCVIQTPHHQYTTKLSSRNHVWYRPHTTNTRPHTTYTIQSSHHGTMCDTDPTPPIHYKASITKPCVIQTPHHQYTTKLPSRNHKWYRPRETIICPLCMMMSCSWFIPHGKA